LFLDKPLTLWDGALTKDPRRVCASTNSGFAKQDSFVKHYKVFIQKWQILDPGKAAQGFSPQA